MTEKSSGQDRAKDLAKEAIGAAKEVATERSSRQDKGAALNPEYNPMDNLPIILCEGRLLFYRRSYRVLDRGYEQKSGPNIKARNGCTSLVTNTTLHPPRATAHDPNVLFC